MQQILVIEDDSAVQRVLKRIFEAEGYAVDLTKDGTSGLACFRKTVPSVIILDLHLPDISGQEVCKRIAQADPTMPIVVLSASADEVDKVVLLEMGARDYVTKPFSPKELLARIRAAIRSANDICWNAFRFGDVTVDFPKLEVTRGGSPVLLCPKEFETLKFMIRNAERIISRDELLSAVWGYQAYRATRTVDNHILRLRQKLETDPVHPVHFRTIPRVGYKFVP